jgi:beta-lysine 5,6-aminomutase alpha subunit
MLTEALHTPHLHDRMLSIENAKYVFNNARDIGEEVEYKKDGIIQKRAQEVLKDADELLHQMEKDGLFATIEAGKFAAIKRPLNGGKGLEGVCKKDNFYFNPFIEKMLGGANNE